MLIGSVVCCALYNVVFKRHAGATNPLALTAAFLAVTAAVVSGGAAVFERAAPPWPPPFAPTVALVYLALIGSVVAFASYFYLLRRVRLSTVASLVLVEPVIALLVDAFWERQRIEPRAYLGVAVTLAGVFINFAGERRRAREVAP
jgi:drug/metabolite transporter (DMT)-like permease